MEIIQAKKRLAPSLKALFNVQVECKYQIPESIHSMDGFSRSIIVIIILF